MWRALGNISYDLKPKVKGQMMYFLVNASLNNVKCQIMYFLVNASFP